MAKIEVSGSAMIKPAKTGFLPASQDVKAITVADTNILSTNIIIYFSVLASLTRGKNHLKPFCQRLKDPRGVLQKYRSLGTCLSGRQATAIRMSGERVFYSSINISPVPHIDHINDQLVPTNHVEYSIIADAIRISAFQLALKRLALEGVSLKIVKSNYYPLIQYGFFCLYLT